MTPTNPTQNQTEHEVDLTFRDASLSVAERVENLLSQMTLEEKAGLFFHAMITIGEGGTVADAVPIFGIASTADMISNRRMTHFNVFGAASSARDMAAWQNRLQELAASTRLGIPVTLSTDPRHSFTENPGTAMLSGPFSQWPETLGLAAIGDADLVERFGDIARREYTAVGQRVALHPQIDLTTEPRWARQVGTFGEDADLTSRLGAAYIRGFQGAKLGSTSVATMTKHFPGGGPQKDGEDPHFAYGREQVYPGDNFEYHLKPFEAALKAGTSQIMPYYGMPVGTAFEEVGFGFNKSIITGLLRDRYSFDGIVCTDWGLLSDSTIAGQPFPARAWGVEDLSTRDRMIKVLNAGADQFGGESIPELLVELVNSDEISVERLDVSARRLLREKFVLGLFDNPFVDVDQADAIVGNTEFRAAGDAAQRAAITLLTNGVDAPTLPLSRGVKVYLHGVDPDVAGSYANVVSTPEEADFALVRIQAPFEQRTTMFENFFHAGSLDFPQDQIDDILALTRTVPTIISVFLDRPAILAPFTQSAAAILGEFGASTHALLDVIFGAAIPQGKLPFDLPASMNAVREARTDVPFDTTNAHFPFGHGLTY